MTIINKNKTLSILLTLVLLLTNFNLLAYADINDNSNSLFRETSDGFILQYEQLEEDKNVYYVEEVKGNVVNTKKYYKNNYELEFFEEINTIIDHKDDGSIIATINNITKNTIETQVVKGKSIDTIETQVVRDKSKDTIESLDFTPGISTLSSSKEWHPLHSDYYKVTRITGHLGLANLTKAGIASALGSMITGGNLVSGSIAGIATLVYNGGWSNLYYEETTYDPYGSGPGRPLWKKIVKHYYDRERTQQAGDTLYYDADILTQY